MDLPWRLGSGARTSCGRLRHALAPTSPNRNVERRRPAVSHTCLVTDAFDREVALLGTWHGCGSNRGEWPVSPDGRRAVDWALETHRDFFSDEWLTAMCQVGHHPLTSTGCWPLSHHQAIVRLLERAARIATLSPTCRSHLSAALTRDPAEFQHLEVVLEVAGLATRYGWLVEPELELTTGRRPDLRVTRHGMAFSVEVTRLGTDRSWRQADLWFEDFHYGLLAIEAKHGVTAAGGPPSPAAITSVDLPQFLARVEAAAPVVARDGMARTVSAEDGLTVTLHPDAREGRRLNGPPVTGDTWSRLASRLRTKAERTAGGPPTWIRVDEQSGLFLFTDWAQRPPDVQLALLHTNMQRVLAPYRHVRGVILSHGTARNDGRASRTVVREPVHDALRVGPASLDRELPGRRVRRTLVIPIEAPRILLRDHLEAEPVRWYADEPSWLDWSLRRSGQPPVAGILTGDTHVRA